MNLLLSYPRSGNTWFRCCIEVLTEMWTLPNTSNFGIIRNTFKEKSGIILNKRHILKNEDKNPNNKLILLLRNYKEVIIRHCSINKINQCIHLTFHAENFKFNYIQNISDFDKWQGEKLLIYYEDFILNPEKELKRSLDFLGQDESKLENFVSNFEFYKNKGITVYTNGNKNKSITEGNTTIYHSKKINKEERIQWDTVVKNRVPNLYDKYLIKYSELEK